MAVTFTILGTLASILGKLIGTSSSWWYIALGVLMVFMALQVWEVYNFIPSTSLTTKKPKKGYIGAFVTKLTLSNKYSTFSKMLKYLMGGAIMLIALYMFYLGF